MYAKKSAKKSDDKSKTSKNETSKMSKMSKNLSTKATDEEMRRITSKK